MSQSNRTKKYLKAYRRLRGPAWRLSLAAGQHFYRMRPKFCEADPDAREVRDFQRILGNSGETRAAARYPIIAAAFELNEDEEKCAAAKILTLGDCPQSDIAARLGVEESIVDKWERLHFDVRQGRHATSWIFAQIIRPEQKRGNGQFASRLKAALVGGRVMAHALLDLDFRVPVTAGEKLFDRKVALHLKFDEAAELPLVSNREKMFFIKTYIALRHRENQLELAQKKFERRCAEIRDKHKLAKMRIEWAQEREAARAEMRVRRNCERALEKWKKRRYRESLVRLRQAQFWAEKKAAKARAAVCPLSRLTWASMVGPATSVSNYADSGSTDTEPRRDGVDYKEAKQLVAAG